MGRLFGVDFHVVLEAFDVFNAVEVDLQQLVFAFHKYALGFAAATGCGLLLLPCEREPLQCAVAGLQKVDVAYGLHQVVERIDAVAVEGILLKRRGKHHPGALGQHARQFKPVELGHLNVEECQVHWIVGEALHGIYRVGILSAQFHKRNALHIAHQQLHRQRLVVNYGTLQSHFQSLFLSNIPCRRE